MEDKKNIDIKFLTLSLKVVMVLSLFSPSTTLAHPGRTDSYGCHTCRTNCPKWGLDYSEYHCHQAKSLPQPLDPIKSHRGDNGAGYTTPAPEYKQPAPISPPVAAVKSVTPQKRGFWQWLFGLFGN